MQKIGKRAPKGGRGERSTYTSLILSISKGAQKIVCSASYIERCKKGKNANPVSSPFVEKSTAFVYVFA